MKIRKADEKIELKLPQKTPIQALEEKLDKVEKKMDRLLKALTSSPAKK